MLVLFSLSSVLLFLEMVTCREGGAAGPRAGKGGPVSLGAEPGGKMLASMESVLGRRSHRKFPHSIRLSALHGAFGQNGSRSYGSGVVDQ